MCPSGATCLPFGLLFQWVSNINCYPLANEVAKGYSNVTVLPWRPCEHSRINILQWILTKLGTYLVLKRIWNPIDFQGQRSRSQVQIFRQGDTPRFVLPLLIYWWNCWPSLFKLSFLNQGTVKVGYPWFFVIESIYRFLQHHQSQILMPPEKNYKGWEKVKVLWLKKSLLKWSRN